MPCVQLNLQRQLSIQLVLLLESWNNWILESYNYNLFSWVDADWMDDSRKKHGFVINW